MVAKGCGKRFPGELVHDNCRVENWLWFYTKNEPPAITMTAQAGSPYLNYVYNPLRQFCGDGDTWQLLCTDCVKKEGLVW